jgi:competence protein ComEA
MKNNLLLVKVFFLLVLLSGCDHSSRFFLDAPTSFDIYVDGAIKNPRKITIQPYATIEDVLEEVILLETSDLSSLNLQTILHHNDKLTIPFLQEEACININNGTIEQLSSLHQIGPIIAQRIVDYRNEHGLFQHIDDIVLVKGIGEKALMKNRDRLCL